MTIIAACSDRMVADSGVFRGRFVYSNGCPKIVRCRDGSLTGAAGNGALCQYYMDIASELRPIEDIPFHETRLSSAREDGFDAIHLRVDGTIWRLMSPYFFWERYYGRVVTIGENDACTFFEGACAAGATVERAMALTLDVALYVKAPMQVERLFPVG